jgi:hypothetical protein
MSPTRPFLLSALLAALVPGSSPAAEPPITEKDVREAIATLMARPLTPAGEAAAKKIAVFAVKSKDVVVVLGEEMPWLKKKPKHGMLLMSAYIAGSVRSQLDTGVMRHDPYSALLSVFRLYRVLRKEDPKYRVPEIEALLKLHEEGKRMKHLLTLAEKKKKGDERGGCVPPKKG